MKAAAEVISAGISAIAQGGSKTQVTKRLLEAGVSEADAQGLVNQIEAKSGNLFVAGWRPFIGWICGLGLLVSIITIAAPSIGVLFGLVLTKEEVEALDSLHGALTNSLYPVMMGMLGLGAARTVEKMGGAARETLYSPKYLKKHGK